MKHVRLFTFLLIMILSGCGGDATVQTSDPNEVITPTVESVVEPEIESETMTETEGLVEGEVMTETEMMDSGETMTATETMDDGSVMTATEMVTETNGMTESGAAPDEMAEDAAMRPSWQQLPLVNARTGETFALVDFAGKTVFVEPMATWCTNCRQQLTNVKAAQAMLDDPTVVFVALSVETNLEHDVLAQYADDAGFDWLFAVATPDLLQELNDIFGRTIANPPATPHFVIRSDGTTTDLVTGIDPAEQIVSMMQAAMQ